MEHTYLFQEGLWISTGEYLDETGRAQSVKGHSRVTHGGVWEVETFMQLMDQPHPTFENSYRVLPFKTGADCTAWTSHDPDLGNFAGRFFLVGDTILSICAAEDGKYTGSEFFLRLDRDVYLNRGALFREQDRIAGWSIRLVRVRGKE